jgi:multimeric flavodoxin WrbA
VRVWALATSPRHGGNSESLLDLALAEIRAAGHDVVKRELTAYRILPCVAHDGCRKMPACPQPDDFVALADEGMAADAVLFAIPVYYWGVPAQFKAYIDRHVHYYGRRKYKARAIGLIIVAADDGIKETEDQMHSFLTKGGHGAIPWNEVRILRAFAAGRDEALQNPELIEQASNFGRRLAQSLSNS